MSHGEIVFCLACGLITVNMVKLFLACRVLPCLGSRIPNPYFLELSDKFLGKKFYNSLKTGPNFFLQHFKNKIIFNFVKFVARKKGMTINFFSPLSDVSVFGSATLLFYWIAELQTKSVEVPPYSC